MENTNSWRLTAGMVSAGIISGGLISYVAQKLYKGQEDPKDALIPRKWLRVGEVSKLIIYPIKSCQGVELPEVSATPIGLKGSSEVMRDRIFMVVDYRYSFQTQRALPRMALIRVTFSENLNEVTVSAPGMTPLTISTPDNVRENKRSCRVWDDHVREVLDCGDEIGLWLDTFLEGTGYRLVYHSLVKTQRTLTPTQHKFPTFLPNHKGSFQDQTSYMFMTEESVAHLNRKLPDPIVTYRNFRPSILIRGVPEALAEDFWGFVRVGSGEDAPIFKTSKPCTRCRLTTINPDTAEFDTEGEPLKTLVEGMQRSFGDSMVDELVGDMGVIGLQLGLYKEGRPLRVGDPVYVALL